MVIVGRAKYTRAREISRRRDALELELELSRARVCILPAPQSQSPKLETTRSLGVREEICVVASDKFIYFLSGFYQD